MTFDDLNFEPHPNGPGIRAYVEFENGYGASIIQTPFSYGNTHGKYELAVFHEGGITFATPIADDFIGWLIPGEVTKYLQQIEALPAKDTNQ